MLHPIDRRDFLRGAGAAFLATLAPRAAEALERSETLFASACDFAGGGLGCAVFDEHGRIVSRIALPDRGHDVAFDPGSGRAVAFARRPGTFAAVFDPRGGAVETVIHSQAGRHFFGHGFFSPDGRLLYATENEFDTGRGLLGVYDATDGFRRRGEFDTLGTDPHEALLLADGVTVAVANGGIETHPDFGRQKLNLATMEPSLVLIDRRDGRLVERHVLPPELHQLSIRHLSVDARGAIWFGCQFEGPERERPQLVGSVRRGEEMRLVDLPMPELDRLANYVGSVAASADGTYVALASPRGNRVLVLDGASGAVVRGFDLAEGCGLAALGEQAAFMATGGGGRFGPLGMADPFREDVAWDNHILRF